MNERIRLLWRQAVLNNTKTPMNFQDAADEFAELIVFECAKAVMDGTKEGDHYAQRIEQHFDNGTDGVLHFGVKE